MRTQTIFPIVARRKRAVTRGRKRMTVGGRASSRLEPLEDRLLFSGHAVHTLFAGGNLTVTVSGADHVTITEAVAKGGN